MYIVTCCNIRVIQYVHNDLNETSSRLIYDRIIFSQFVECEVNIKISELPARECERDLRFIGMPSSSYSISGVRTRLARSRPETKTTHSDSVSCRVVHSRSKLASSSISDSTIVDWTMWCSRIRGSGQRVSFAVGCAISSTSLYNSVYTFVYEYRLISLQTT